MKTPVLHTDIRRHRRLPVANQYTIMAATRDISKMAHVVYQDAFGIEASDQVVTPPCYTKLDGSVAMFPMPPWLSAAI